jgi:hypothetical protein
MFLTLFQLLRNQSTDEIILILRLLHLEKGKWAQSGLDILPFADADYNIIFLNRFHRSYLL